LIFPDIRIFHECPGKRQVIHFGGAARDPKIHNLFQIADVDSGVIGWVNADLVTQILS
tara:strand:- start:78 stop:251 length:174 start_codon:yes stop_codon:yes gene_type:complete